MKVKKAVAIIGSISLILMIIMLYCAKDLTEFSNRKLAVTNDFEDNKWLHFENRIKQLEEGLNKHSNAVDEIKVAMQIMASPSSKTRLTKSSKITSKQKVLATEMLYERNCPIQTDFIPKTDIQMLDLYKNVNFDNIDGGVWKQGWKIEIDEKDWNRQNKLKVFVVPHSHNDPGWIKTFDEYFITQTKRILDNMLMKLPEDPRRKFIWAEISFFAMWWDDLDEDQRSVCRRLLRNNQLEIVTGGWVMNDEANAHWISIINQLTEGHQWLQKTLNYTPQSSWSIDPFGMSSNQPILLKKMGLRHMLIQRVHYRVKKELASKKQLEFRWRQLWDGSGKTDMFTHMMPFYSYDIPHTCGPDPKVCCQFDFKRIPGHGLHCPWKIAPQIITEKNVAQKAELLLDQYRKKSKLFKTNVLLAPLGDDFRYDHQTEWDLQYNNYQKLFDHMNANLNLNVQAQFGTLTDYFEAVLNEKKENTFPTLSGDFFTYADRDDHYWSGYYTSRPFYKRMDRVLLSYVRAAETILTLAFLSGKPGSSWVIDEQLGLEKSLSVARKSLALFQHHDGITGTAKDHVVIDYAKKMLIAITKCQRVIQQCANMLLGGDGGDMPNQETFYNIDDIRHSFDSLSEKHQITIGPELRTKKIVIYNSLTFTRTEVVTFYVSTPFVEVLDHKNTRIQCQVSPVFEYGSTMSQTKYQLSFIPKIPALGLSSFTVNAVWDDRLPSETKFASIKIYNQYNDVQTPLGLNDIEVSPSASEFTLHNDKVIASFNELGLLKALKIDTMTIPVHLDFAKYGVKRTRETSGAYLFLPDGEAVPLKIENTIVNVIEGSIMSSVTIQIPFVRHTVALYASSGADSLGIEIENIVDISKTSNFELAMRLSTNIISKDEFFTDVNGFDIIRRKLFEKLPLQANYYPMPTTAYIEDEQLRLTLVSSSPLGCSSLKTGQLEVMLDRRLDQDDNLGLGQGVRDNHPTRHFFRVLIEKKTQTCQTTVNGHPSGFPTLGAYVSRQSLLNPLIRLLKNSDDDSISLTTYNNVEEEFGVDFSIPVLRTGILIKGNKHIGLVLHRQFLNLCYSNNQLLQSFPISSGSVNISAILPTEIGSKLYRTSLSFLLLENEVHIKSDINQCPMEIQAFIIKR